MMNIFLPRLGLYPIRIRYGFLALLLAAFGALALGLARPAYAAEEAPDALIQRVTTDVLSQIRADKSIRAGDMSKIMQLVNDQVMPNIDFQRMTAATVGPAWRQAAPEQKQRLQQEFKTLLVRTYAGALTQVSDQTVTLQPFRAAPGDTDVLVRTVVRNANGGGKAVQIDYRLAKAQDAPGGWRVYNLNVMGIWLVDTYRTQFAQEINAHGIDGLINALAERNKALQNGDPRN